jgi:double-GTPase-like protein
MNLLSRKIICPFCFASFSAQKIVFRCLNPRCSGRAEDIVYAGARGYAPASMGHVLPSSKSILSVGVPSVVECTVCKKETRTRLCPTCHYELSHDVGRIDQRIIAIIGGSNTGKSHYIASLINRLQHEVGRNFDFSVSMIGDGTRDRWMNDFYRPLFENKNVLAPTQRVELDLRVKIPLIFRLTLKRGHHIRALNISFFDTAGEDMANLQRDLLSVEARYICHANAIIVLLDPLQLEVIRHQLPNANLPKSDPMARPDFIVQRLRELFEQYHRLSATKKIQIPIAFALSKADTLKPILPPDSALLRSGEHFGMLDLQDIQSVSTEIGNYIQSWINPSFYQDIGLKFATYRFFGISSLGRQPDSSNHLADVNPRRVEDPFLWLLYQFNLIRGQKGR